MAWWEPGVGVAEKDELGRRGEELAVEYLESNGLIVLARNWRCSEGELDIVATDRLKTTVVFCEVKTRSGEGYGSALEAVTAAKRRKIRRLATLWLGRYGRSWKITRFDVVGVLWPAEGKPTIDHRERAF